MKVKAKCARALIRYFKAKESERENSNELCTTKLYNATCRQRVCGQNKDNLSLHAARTLIWRSCAFNRRPMTMPVLDGVKPMAITLPICGTSESLFWKRKKSIYCWTRSRPTWTFGESNDQVRDKSESKYQRVHDKSETVEKRLESGLESETGLKYYSPTSLFSGRTLKNATHVSRKSCIIRPIRWRLRNSWSVSTFVCHMHQTFSLWRYFHVSRILDMWTHFLSFLLQMQLAPSFIYLLLGW